MPYAALIERSRQELIQRNTMAGGAGARPTDINLIGDSGLLFNDYSSILSQMMMRSGLRGAQKVPFFTAQGSAAGGEEGSDIPLSVYTMHNEDLLPVSVGSAFDLSSSLAATDPGDFEGLVRFAIGAVINDEMVGQFLTGGGAAVHQVAGLWDA